jgi:hypothetical protein
MKIAKMARNNSSLSKFYDPTAFVLLVLVVLSFIGAWNYAEEMPGIDYYVAWVAADATRNGSEHAIYSKEGRYRLGREYRTTALDVNPDSRQAASARIQSVPHMTATPFMYWVIKLFSSGDYESDLTIWHAISLVLFVFSVAVFCRMSGYSTAALLAILLPCLVWMEPLHADLRVANVNGFQLGILGLILLLLSKDSNRRMLFVASFMVALLVMFKPNLAPVSILLAGAWLIRGQYHKLFTGLAGMVAGTLVALAVSSYFFGDAMAWIDWVRAISSPAYQSVEAGRGNFSPGQSFKLGFQGQAILSLALCALVLVFFWWGSKTGGEKSAPSAGQPQAMATVEYAQLLGLGCLVHMFVSPLVWTHYYLLAIPVLIVAFRPWPEGSERNRLSPLLHRVLPAIALLCLMATPIRGFFDMEDLDFYATVNLTAICILALLGLWQLRFRDSG